MVFLTFVVLGEIIYHRVTMMMPRSGFFFSHLDVSFYCAYNSITFVFHKSKKIMTV